MKEIKLTQGKVAIVDDDDFDYLSQFKWCANKHGKTFYAERADYSHGKPKILYMHRVIIQTPSNMQVDHIDFNGLNNMKVNLRNCTHSQNIMNQRPNLNNSSKYKGVWWNKEKNKYHSQIRANQKRISIGYFTNEEDAAKAYDKIAKIYHGEFANLNFK
jgi:hypothetical protein